MLTTSALLVMAYGIVGYISSPISDAALYGLMIFSSILLIQSAVILAKNPTVKPTAFRMTVEGLISTVPITGVVIFFIKIDSHVMTTLLFLLVVQIAVTIQFWKEGGAKR